MQHLHADDELRQIWANIYDNMTPEEREAFYPAEEIVKKLTPEQRLAGLPPEQRLEGLTPEERERLLTFLQRSVPPKSRKPKRRKKTD